MSRQSLTRHIKHLADAGLVVELPDLGDGVRYAAKSSRLFEVLESTRSLAEIPAWGGEDDQTRIGEHTPARKRRKGRELVLVKGVREGRIFALDETITIGRSKEAGITLDYDSFVSGFHARIHVDGRKVSLESLPGGRNGVFLNGGLVPSDEAIDLRSGDIIDIGMSTLVYRT